MDFTLNDILGFKNMSKVIITPSGVRVVWDAEGDVLYARFSDCKVVTRHESDFDTELILEYDDARKIVGLVLIGINVLGSAWKTHPSRDIMPEALREVVDHYTNTR